MATKKTPGDPKRPLQEESAVARLKSVTGGAPAGLTTYTGLLGRSSKEGYWLLYASLDMSLCIEIQESDIVHSEELPPEQSPFGGLGGTRVFVRKGAQVTTTRTFTRTHQAGADDEFDLDIRVGQARSRGGPIVQAANTEADNCTERCGTGACPTATCGATCGGTCGGTCDTQCGQPNCPSHQTCTCNCTMTCNDLTCNDLTCVFGPSCNTCKTDCNTECQRTKCKCSPVPVFTKSCGDTCLACTNTCTNNVPCRC